MSTFFDGGTVQVLSAITPGLAKMAAQQCRFHRPLKSTGLHTESEEWIVDKLLAGGRGHYGPLEHLNIVLQVHDFSHCMMQQLRTHRHLSFDVESFRSSHKFLEHCYQMGELEEAFKFPKKLEPHAPQIQEQVQQAMTQYMELRRLGHKPEDARFVLPGYALRENFVASGNLRAWWHILDMRSKANAQREIQEFCSALDHELGELYPLLQSWYRRNRWSKAILSP